MVIKTKKLNKTKLSSIKKYIVKKNTKSKHIKKHSKKKYNKKQHNHNNSNSKKENIQQGGATGGTVCAPYVIDKGAVVDKEKEAKVLNPVHSNSCLTLTALNKLVNSWNKEIDNPKYKINTNMRPDKIYNTMVKIFNQTNSRLLPEHEWWEQPWVQKNLSTYEIEEIKQKHYSPDAPKSWIDNPNEWLSTLEIDAKLQQYENKYPEFKYYGATPIDFDLKSSTGSCQVNSLCNINLSSLLSQKTPKNYIGVVFNLDKHNEPGSHWIALFVNIPKAEINYWDSYAVNPPNEVDKLMDKLVEQGNKLKNPIKFKKNINNVRHQYKGSECGVYSCYFIISQLDGRTFTDVVSKVVSDDKMNAMRKDFFNYSET